MGSSTNPDAEPCLICGTRAEPTVEHIIPQTLLKKFKLDPNAPDLAPYRTWLCDPHNKKTGELHRRTDTMKLIAYGIPRTREALDHLGKWAVWVTMLLGLAQPGRGVIPDEQARELLRRRFDERGSAALPEGVRVYAAAVDRYGTGGQSTSAAVPRFAVALHGDRRVIVHGGDPIGYSVESGSMSATATIGLGKFALLVLGKTHSSGPDHEARLDDAAATAGLEPIQPLRKRLPELRPGLVDMGAVARLFTVVPSADVEISLLPERIRVLENLGREL